MFKILIVDGNPIIRMGLIKMINWKELDAQLAGEAENGNKAIELIKKLRPEVVVTDIRMPEADGLSLLKTIANSFPAIKTIVISGYSDFEYMKQAIKSGSVDYILKPVEPSELNLSLRKAFEAYKKDAAPSIDSEEKAVSEYLLDLALGRSTDEKPIPLPLSFILENNILYNVAILRAKDGDTSMYAAYDIFKDVRGFTKVYSIPLPGNRGSEKVLKEDKLLQKNVIESGSEMVAIFIEKDSTDEQIFEAKVYNSICRTLSAINGFAERVCVSIGKVSRGYQGIFESYDTACRISDYAILDGTCSPIRYSDTVKRKCINFFTTEYEDRLILNITAGNSVQVTSILDEVIGTVLKEKDISLESMRLLLSTLGHLLMKVDNGIVDEIQKFLKDMNKPGFFLKFRSIDNVSQVMYNLYVFTTRKYAEIYGGKNSVVLRVREFIDLNYAREIGLETIANLFHVNMSYLSSLYKKETGENINEYITKKRIQSAERILSTESVKLPDLANMVGYQDYTYFQKVFKKVTGRSPREFKLDGGNKKSAR